MNHGDTTKPRKKKTSVPSDTSWLEMLGCHGLVCDPNLPSITPCTISEGIFNWPLRGARRAQDPARRDFATVATWVFRTHSVTAWLNHQLPEQESEPPLVNRCDFFSPWLRTIYRYYRWCSHLTALCIGDVPWFRAYVVSKSCPAWFTSNISIRFQGHHEAADTSRSQDSESSLMIDHQQIFCGWNYGKK